MTALPTAELPAALIPEEGGPEAGGLLKGDGFLYLVRGPRVFRCADTPEGRSLLRAVAGATAGGESRPEVRTARDALRLMLQGCAPEQAEQLARRFRIRLPDAYCMIALRGGEDLYGTVRALAPMEPGDLLGDCGADTAVLIKRGTETDEAEQFTLALLDTLEGEAGIKPEAGIGEIHRGTAEWPEALREALSAIRTAREFRLRAPVQVYRRQTLERLLGMIPAEKRRALRRELFAHGAEGALSQEMTETAEAFFASDLNLSVAARQMFIHRNTLTYRLDKIRRATGLDLRRFGDAVIFRILTALPEEDPDQDTER